MLNHFPSLKIALFLTFSVIFVMAATITTSGSNIDNDWWRNAVIYQIYPRSFKDSNGDGVGDLRGIISSLDYLVEMGVTATWLSPIFQSPMVDFGYDISDFRAVHHEYGTMQDFEDLIAEATRRNLKIILDFVPNHTSDQCEWFVKSVERVEGYEDFYVWADGKESEDGKREPPNNWQSLFYGSAWQWNEKRQQFYLHQFASQQPDLNYRNPKVVEAMDAVIRFWLDKGVSGFRVDAVNHLFESAGLEDEPLSGKTSDPKSYEYTEHIHTKDLPEVLSMLHHWRQLLDDYTAQHGGPARIMMTEAYADLKLLMDYYEDAKGVKGAHFPFNFQFIGALNPESDARDYVYIIQKWLTYMPRGHVPNWLLGNHDNPRVASRFGAERVDALNMLLLTLPGVAVTYNGEELGMQDHRALSWEQTVDPLARNSDPADYQKFSRDPVRTPFQWDASANAGFSTAAKTWLPVHPDFEKLNLAQQKAAPRSHFKVYRRLVQLRELPVLREGKFNAQVISRHVFAYTRHLRGQPTVVVVINVSCQQQSVNLTELDDLPAKLQVLVAGSASSYNEGNAINATVLSLPANECIVLQGQPTTLSAERRALIRTLIKSANFILVGLLVYKLWNNKWTKLKFVDEAAFLKSPNKNRRARRNRRF